MNKRRMLICTAKAAGFVALRPTDGTFEIREHISSHRQRLWP